MNTSSMVIVVPENDLVKAFYFYSENFYLAAHEVASLLIEKEPVDTTKFDTCVLPLVFLYRHSLELLIKSIAFEKIFNRIERVEFVKKTHHDLYALLDHVINDGQICPDNALKWLKLFFSDISKVDKESDSFRYPFHIDCTHDTPNGEIHYSIKKVFEEQTYIDLYKIANKFEIAHDILISLSQTDEDIDDYSDFNPVLLEDGDYYFQAVTGYGFNWSGYTQYIHGYKDAAHYLRTLMDKSQDKATKLFFPMCYLYRNAIELHLKEVWVDECLENYQKRLKLLNKKKHSIAGIWNAIRKWDENFWTDDKYDIEIQKFFDSITKRCMDINSRDSKASRYRYPCDDKMNLYYKKETKIDYMEIAESMEIYTMT